MGRLAAVDLGRYDRIGNIQVIIARVFVKRHEIISEMLSRCGEERGFGGKPGKETRHMIRGAAHQTEGLLSPTLDHAALRSEVLRRSRNMVAAEHWFSGPGRLVCHQITVLRVRSNV